MRYAPRISKIEILFALKCRAGLRANKARGRRCTPPSLIYKTNRAKSTIGFLGLILFGIFTLPLHATQPAPLLEMVPQQSSIRFIATVNNAPSQGSFEDFTADIRFAPNHLPGSKVTVTVNMASVMSSYPEVADNLRLPLWFAAEDFPKAIFETTNFTHVEGNHYRADATLTIRERSHPITLDFILENYDKTGAHVTGTTTFNRTDFSVGQNEWLDTGIVKDPVTVEIELVAKRQGISD